MLTIASLHVYPLKGAAGFSPARWPVDARGLRDDRTFMVVRADGSFVSQREERRLALVRVTVEADEISIGFPDGEPVRVARRPGGGERAVVSLRESRLDALFPSRDADAALSRFLGFAARLAWLPDRSQRAAGFADASPVLVVTDAALAELNRRLGADARSPVPVDRFRPNLVLRGARGDEDDRWEALRIGDVSFRVEATCKRCIVTTIDQTTAELTGPEPLRTLATYRRERSGVAFGQYATPESAGELAVGDRVLAVDGRASTVGSPGR